jgi:hypothetical protein
VDFDDAKSIGDAGEQRVAELLQRYVDANQPACHLGNVMLSVGRMTAQLDHVVIDSRGILIVEVKVRNAFIRGTGDEPKWTAVYPGSTKRFQNPLEQMTRQRNTLSQALRSAGDPVDPDLLHSLVVFVGAKIESLELDSENWRRVTTIAGLPALLSERGAVRPRFGLSEDQIAARCRQIDSLDRADDLEVQQRHAAYRGGASIPTAAPSRPTPMPAPPAEPKVTFSGNPHRPRPARAVQPPAPPAPRHGTDPSSCRPGTQPPAFVAPERWRNGAPRSSAARKVREFFVALVVLAVFWACAVTGVYQGLVTAVLAPMFRMTAPAASAPAVAPSNAPTLTQAQDQLFQVAPQLRGTVTDLNTPLMSASADSITYTWHYATKVSGSKAVITTYGLTLGPGGVLRAVLPGQ